MKIAVPTKENNHVDAHFGHCEFYTIFVVSENKEIMAETILESPKGCGCKSNIASDLSELGVRIMLAGGIGDGAVKTLAAHNIEVIRNCKGNVHQLVEDYLVGKIQDSGSNCTAHGTDGEHVCSHN